MNNAVRERVARAICASCGDRPDATGDARGNVYRWQDYLDSADAVLAALKTDGNTDANAVALLGGTDAVLDRLKPSEAKPAEPCCVWTQDNADYSWDGTCTVKWEFTNAGPEENGCVFCPRCGKPIRLAGEERP